MNADQLNKELVSLNGFTSETQLNQAKLILRASGFPYGALKEVKSVSDLHVLLQRHSSQFVGYDATCLLQYVLQAVCVHRDKVKELGSSPEALSLCQKKLAFGELVSKLCYDITEDDFENLKHLVAPHLNVTPEKIKSREDLFHRCLSQNVLSENNVSKLEDWLGTLGRVDLQAKLSEYSVTHTHKCNLEQQQDVRHPVQESRADQTPSNDQPGEIQSGTPIQETGPGDTSPPPLNTGSDFRSVAEGEDHLERDSSSQVIKHSNMGLKSVTVENPPESGPLTNSGALIEPRPATSIQEDETKKEEEEQPLLDLKKKSASGFPWLCFFKLFFIFLLLFIFTVILIFIAFFLTALTHSQVTLMAGDTVECSRANSLFLKGWDLTKTTDKEFDVTFKSVKENELESLQESKTSFYQDYTIPPQTTSRRVNIPQGPYIFPYLMTGSNISVSICLDSNATTPISAHLFIFDSNEANDKFKKNKSDSTENAVHMSPLSVGTERCRNVPPYRVRNSAYYYVALEVPSGVRVDNNITLDVVYVNSSKLSQNPDCVLDSQKRSCSIKNGFSAKKQVLLCYTPPATRSESHKTVIDVSNVRRFFVMMIVGFFFCVCVLVVGVVLVPIFCVKKCRKNENT